LTTVTLETQLGSATRFTGVLTPPLLLPPPVEQEAVTARRLLTP
jgi:hypothetical protein